MTAWACTITVLMQCVLQGNRRAHKHKRYEHVSQGSGLSWAVG
jgi:hypothetical protein